MNKLKFFGIAAMAVMILAGCSKEGAGNVGPFDEKPFYIKITQDPLSRAEGGDMSSASVVFEDGYLIFTALDEATLQNRIKRVIKIVSNATGDDEVTVAKLKDGYVIEDLDGASNRCYLIGNLGTSISGITTAALAGEDYKDVAKLLWTLADLQDATNNTVAKIPVYGEGTVAYSVSNDRLESQFQVKPVGARLQIGEIKISDSDIEGFKLAGIYINGFYQSMTVSQTPTGMVDYGVDKSKYTQANYTSDGYACMTDDISATALTTSVTPENEAYWAYNIFPGQLPRIVLHFSEVQFDSSMDLEYYTVTNKYATVAKYNSASDLSGAEVSTANAGKVYKIASIDITDYAEQVDDVPEANSKLQGYVEIEIIDWSGEDLFPDW